MIVSDHLDINRQTTGITCKENIVVKRSVSGRSGALLFCAMFGGAPLLVAMAEHNVVYAQDAVKILNQQLDSLTAPIALYPDALLAQVLMATTFPQDVQAA